MRPSFAGMLSARAAPIRILSLGAKLRSNEGVEPFRVWLYSYCALPFVPRRVVVRVPCGDHSDPMGARHVDDFHHRGLESRGEIVRYMKKDVGASTPSPLCEGLPTRPAPIWSRQA